MWISNPCSCTPVLPLKSNPLRSPHQRKPLCLLQPWACPAPEQLHKASSPPQYLCNVVFLNTIFLCEHRWAEKSICSLELPFCPSLSAIGSGMQFPDLHISQYIYFTAGTACSHTLLTVVHVLQLQQIQSVLQWLLSQFCVTTTPRAIKNYTQTHTAHKLRSLFPIFFNLQSFKCKTVSKKKEKVPLFETSQSEVIWSLKAKSLSVIQNSYWNVMELLNATRRSSALWIVEVKMNTISYRHFFLDIFMCTFTANLGLCLNKKDILRSSAAVMVR